MSCCYVSTWPILNDIIFSRCLLHALEDALMIRRISSNTHAIKGPHFSSSFQASSINMISPNKTCYFGSMVRCHREPESALSLAQYVKLGTLKWAVLPFFGCRLIDYV